MRAEPLEPRRIRHPRGAYGWVDLRIVTEGHLVGLGPQAALVYLFLCTVGNRAGISFWSRTRIARMLNLTLAEIENALARMIAADLIAANDRVVQVLPVPDRCCGNLATQDGAGHAKEDPSRTKSPSPPSAEPPIPQRAPIEFTDDEVRAHESEARAHIARFYGAREPSESVVRAVARSLARKSTAGRRA